MAFVPKAHEIYKHFKGGLYQITAVAEHTETGEQLVVYQALYGDFKTYARPLDMFTGKVDREKYPDAGQEYRFELQKPEEERQAAEPERNPQASEGELALDPMVLEFLDSDDYEQKLNILAGLHHRITDDMITTMAIACDVEVDEGDTEERFESLRNCLLTLEKYECNRQR